MLDIKKFMRDGWMIVDLPQLSGLVSGISHALQDMAEIEPSSIHEKYADNVKDLHVKFSEFFWGKEYSLSLSYYILPIVKQLIGLDVMVQYYPYFRIARPNKPQDNIGFHKDTQYGQTPYELAVHIPFVDLDEGSALRVISGSHLLPESAFTLVTPEGVKVEKGSIENKIGRPYMPKCLAIPEGMETTPLVMRVGQAAIFSPAIFHGQEVNTGNVTRVSCDLRFVNGLHKDKVKLGKVHAGYVPVSHSPVEKMAGGYYAANM